MNNSYLNFKIGKRKYIGLPNLGNTCYLNSILQVLLNNEMVVEIINSNEDKDTNSYSKILKNLNKNFHHQYSLSRLKILISKLIQQLILFNNRYELNNENDALIFLKDILGLLATNKNELGLRLSNLFKGIIKNEIKCQECSNSQNYEESFTDINLSTFSITEQETFSSLLELWKKEENLIDYDCVSCNSNELVLTKFLLEVPKILVINVNNLKHSDKIDKKIEFYGFKYNLYGLVLFDASNKHYYSQIYNNRNNFFVTLDDSKVNLNNFTHNDNIKIIFYTRTS